MLFLFRAVRRPWIVVVFESRADSSLGIRIDRPVQTFGGSLGRLDMTVNITDIGHGLALMIRPNDICAGRVFISRVAEHAPGFSSLIKSVSAFPDLNGRTGFFYGLALWDAVFRAVSLPDEQHIDAIINILPGISQKIVHFILHD